MGAGEPHPRGMKVGTWMTRIESWCRRDREAAEFREDFSMPGVSGYWRSSVT